MSRTAGPRNARRLRPAGLCALFLTLSICPALRADASAAAAAWARLFADANAPPAEAAINAAIAACGDDVSALKKLIAADAAYAALSPGWHAPPPSRVDDGTKHYEVRSFLRVPEAYRPDAPCPLLLVVPGQKVTGDKAAQLMVRSLGPLAEKVLVLSATLPGPQEYSARAYQEEAFLKPLDWARRALNVDDDRVWLTGYSLGGHSTWHLATMFPHRFAGAVAMAGVPFFEGFPRTATTYLENLGNLRFWSIWGELDAPPPPARGQVHFNREASARLKALGSRLYRGTEIAGADHGGCWPAPDELAAFLHASRRSPVPPRMTHCFHLPAHRRAYYLEAMQFARPPMRLDQPIRVRVTMPGGVKPAPDAFERAARQLLERNLFRMSAELDGRANSLSIRLDGIRTVRVYVLDGMFDLSREVALKLNGRAWRGRVAPSARCVLGHYAADRDATALVLNEIDIDLTARALVRY